MVDRPISRARMDDLARLGRLARRAGDLVRSPIL